MGRDSRRTSFAHQGGYSLPQAHQGSEVRGKRIAAVLQVEFEPLGGKYGCACGRPALPSCKRHGGVLEQEDSANPPVDVTGNPKTFLVAADEKRRNRLIDDAGIKRPKLRGDGRGDIGREQPGSI